MKKKIVRLSLVLMILIALIPNFTHAKQDIKIIVDGKEIKTDVAPYIENGRTMVPARFVSEALNANVKYNNSKDMVFKTESVWITMKDNPKDPDRQFPPALVLYVNTPYASISQGGYDIGTKTVIKNGRTFVPLRFVTDYFDAAIDWNEKTQTITINSRTQAEIVEIWDTAIDKYYSDEVADRVSAPFNVK